MANDLARIVNVVARPTIACEPICPHTQQRETGRFSDTMIDRLAEVGYDPQALGARRAS